MKILLPYCFYRVCRVDNLKQYIDYFKLSILTVNSLKTVRRADRQNTSGILKIEDTNNEFGVKEEICDAVKGTAKEHVGVTEQH